MSPLLTTVHNNTNILNVKNHNNNNITNAKQPYNNYGVDDRSQHGGGMNTSMISDASDINLMNMNSTFYLKP